jgi:hypothetical protein
MKKHCLSIAVLLLLARLAPAATQVDLPGPPGSGQFGTRVAVLPNGNFLVTDPLFDNAAGVVDVGAVYLYTPEGALISSLRGSTTGDQAGSGGIVILANGNFVVRSPNWTNGMAANAGAVTWGSAVSGFIGGPEVIVSTANSLVGSTANDNVGAYTITVLTNGNYVVSNPDWDNGVIVNAGAATWGNGFTGTSGPVSPANSLVGSTANDGLSGFEVKDLTNGNYVVRTPFWNNTAPVASDAGAVTWGNGLTGISGPVSSANSLVGTTMDNRVGGGGITALTNGHYVVVSSSWRNGAIDSAGAVTWGNGVNGITGPVTDTNSLVGTTALDDVGSGGVTALTNGHYVVRSPNWDNTAPAASDAGAVTWGNGNTGTIGPVSAANSLVGSATDDKVGSSGVTALTNGHYVVRSPSWDNGGIGDAGAATWGNGFAGITGPVSTSNSLVGSTFEDRVGSFSITALTNGNYVVNIASWDNGTVVNAGAVTWGDGTKGITGPVSPANSLVGSTTENQVGGGGIAALTNGHYVVRSPLWDNGATLNVGAATWGNGTKGITGPVSSANSLVGSTAEDNVGSGFISILTNGNYVVCSPSWDNGVITDAGAVTWSSGSKGITGFISSANSLVGSTAFDSIGNFSAFTLPNGHYVVRSTNWKNTSAVSVGAVTWCNGFASTTGPVSPSNSLVGSTLNDQVGLSASNFKDNSNYILRTSNWDNGVLTDSGAITLADGQHGTSGEVGALNSVLGTAAGSGGNLFSNYDPARNQLIVGRGASNLVTLFRGDRLRSLAVSGIAAPGAADIAFAKPGSAAVNADGHALTDFFLTGSGSKGKNRALFAHSPISGSDLVLQSGAPISSLGGGLPGDTMATALFGQVFHQPNRALFQASLKGNGITPVNNRLLLLDNGIGVSLLHRTGTPIPALGGASLSSYSEVLQSHDENLITVAYKLKPGGVVTAANDEGLVFFNHSGSIGTNISAREGQTAFDGGGTFGAFSGRAAAGLGTVIHFTAQFKPTGLAPIPAVFSTTEDGVTTARLAKATDTAPSSGGATYNLFPAISQQGGSALVKATLKGSIPSQNEGLYRLPAPGLLTRKGDPIGGGLNIARILRFWPAGPSQVILHLQVIGTGVNASNNQVLALRQSDNSYFILLRTGTPAPGTGPATVKAFSAIDVNPVSGRYAILGTLSGAPSTSNQALWTGNPALGADTPAAQQILRLPQLTLRKGNPYSTDATPQGLIRSIALKPAIDPTGAGGRGLAQALGANGDLAIFITGDRNLTEVVLLDR